MNPETSKLSPIIQAGIAVILLLFFGGVLFVPAVMTNFKVESDTKQTLFTLVTAVVFFFIGKNTGSDVKDAATLHAAINSVPVSSPPLNPTPVVNTPSGPAVPVVEVTKDTGVPK